MSNGTHIDFSRLPEVINQAFYPLLFDQHRYLVLRGGAGSGKSWFTAQKLVYRVVSEERHTILVIRKINRTIKHSAWKLIIATIAAWGMTSLFATNKSDQTITFIPNGNSFIFTGTDDEQKLKSIEGITSCWIEESTELSFDDFTQIDLRVRAYTPTYQQLILSFNPISANHWIKRRFFDSDQRGKTLTHHSTYNDNPHLSREQVNVIQDLVNRDEQYHKIYALGDWGELRGLIYDKPFLMDKWPDEFDETIYGLDFGYNNPMALVRADIVGDEDVYLTEVYYEREQTTDDLIRDLPGLGVESNATIYCDSAEPDRIKMIKRAGYRAIAADKSPGSVKSGIDLVKTLRIHSKPENVNLENERQTHKWKEDKMGNTLDVPLDENNHLLDAVRYALMMRFGKAKTFEFAWI